VLADFAQRLRNGGRSLLRPESIVPELSLPGVPDNY
jgi:hypothetical protein